jgi:murein DD-endopeptidase MepM/ murein hydrolase activator NlpD
VIAIVGNTGKSTGPHLHYEVLHKGRPDNPAKYYYQDLTPEEYDRMIQIADNHGQVMD